MIVATKDVHIYSASWGPDDDGRTVDGPGPLTRCPASPAMCKSLTNGGGRGAKANIVQNYYTCEFFAHPLGWNL